jgi:hypothetical protein
MRDDPETTYERLISRRDLVGLDDTPFVEAYAIRYLTHPKARRSTKDELSATRVIDGIFIRSTKTSTS